MRHAGEGTESMRAARLRVGPSLRYRADIDGLRAVSIIAVVLYHLGVPYFDGGFVGVDVFFVISGYLITRIILAEIRNGSFSFARFYERRVRRLLPTLVVMLLATFAVGFVIMTPQDLALLSKSMTYALAFVANLYFADQGGYFSPSMELAPLLHVWSLAVEEQFYIVWPLLLTLMLRYWPRGTLTMVVLLLLASFAANVILVAQKPLAAFYMPHTRAWELLVGCALALGIFPVPGRTASAFAGMFGLAMIAVAVFSFDSDTIFPGFAAILPTLGAFLVIWSGQSERTPAGSILSIPPLVFIGLVSYAWYIWHWPMIALFRYATERDLTGFEMAVLGSASFGLAALSWKYLEGPVRHGAWWKPPRRVWKAASVAPLPLIALASAGYTTGGFIKRHPEAMQELSREMLTKRAKDRRCARVTPDEPCRLWDGDDENRHVLLWGDSHASALRSLFRDMAEATGVSVSFSGVAACPPLVGVGRNRSRGGRNESCMAMNEAVGRRLREMRFSDVVLVARWNYYLGGEAGDGRPAKDQKYLHDALVAGGSLDQNGDVIARGLRRTLDTIVESGARAWLVMEAPYAGYDVPNRVAREIMRGTPPQTLFGIDMADYERRSRLMQAIIAGTTARIIKPSDRLCERGRCLAVANGKPLYYDDDHVSIHGADRLAPLFSDLFVRDASSGTISAKH